MPTFRPYPVPQRPNFYDEVVQPLNQGLEGFMKVRQQQQDQDYRKFMIDMAKAKEAREQAAHTYEYGDPSMAIPGVNAAPAGPAPSRLNLYEPTTMAGETQYGNVTGGMQPDSMSPRAGGGGGGWVGRFRAWQNSRKSGAPGAGGGEMTDEQIFSPGFGSKRREDYLKSRKSRLDVKETEADINLKGAQADYYKNTKGKTGRYTGWTPQSLETRKRNLLAQLRVAPLAERESILDDIQSIDDIQSQTLQGYGGGSAAGGAPGAAPKPILRSRSRAPGGAVPQYKMGQVAINPQTKERLMFNGTSWVPAPAGRP